MSDPVNAILCSLGAALIPMLQEIPAGGDVVVGCPGDWECALTLDDEDPMLTDADTGATLPFTVVQMGGTEFGDGWAVLRPTTPLQVGQSVTAKKFFSLQGQTYQVLPAEAFDPADGTAEASLDFVASPSSEVVCCGKSTGCGATSCTSKRQRRRAKLEVALATAGRHETQWLYDVTFSVGEAQPIKSELFPWYEATSHTFDLAGPDFCYTLTAQSLADGTRVEVARDCLMAGEGTLEDQDTPLEELNSKLHLCSEPPDGWLSEWCAAWQECDVLPITDECEQAVHHCDPSSRSDAGAPLDDVHDVNLLRKQGDGSLCNLSATAPTSRAVGSAWLTLLVAGLWRRSRRARTPS